MVVERQLQTHIHVIHIIFMMLTTLIHEFRGIIMVNLLWRILPNLSKGAQRLNVNVCVDVLKSFVNFHAYVWVCLGF